jgi:hypothetical protein
MSQECSPLDSSVQWTRIKKGNDLQPQLMCQNVSGLNFYIIFLEWAYPYGASQNSATKLTVQGVLINKLTYPQTVTDRLTDPLTSPLWSPKYEHRQHKITQHIVRKLYSIRCLRACCFRFRMRGFRRRCSIKSVSPCHTIRAAYLSSHVTNCRLKCMNLYFI